MALNDTLQARDYRPEPYGFFYVRDPKLRPIHKASVRDRVLLQAVFRVLYPIFDRRFIFDSYACRYDKGTHAGVRRLRRFFQKASGNYYRPVYALKCDVRKFFYSIDHAILLKLIEREIEGADVLWLLRVIIGSFETTNGRGLPLGNVTSQLFANIYLNELDQFIKHHLKEKYYLRYCDDFVILSNDDKHLADIIAVVDNFLGERLRLHLHPHKVEIRKLSQGVDFLGYVTLPHYTVLRTKTKGRMFKKLHQSHRSPSSVQSYLGLLRHCDGYELREIIKEKFNNKI